MQVIVDTSVWSLALRRAKKATAAPTEAVAIKALQDLIEEGRMAMLGVIRQELLSGIKTAEQFEKLRTALTAFPDVTIESADHEHAAELFNLCRSKGVQGSNTDFLICAVAQRRGWPVLTTDQDFAQFARLFKLQLA